MKWGKMAILIYIFRNIQSIFLGEKLAYSEIKPYLCIVIAESSYNL